MSLREALRGQATVCARLGSPFTARVLKFLADNLQPDTPLGDRLFGWQGDITAAGQSVPLRLAGALHGLVLDRADAGLSAVYPPNPAPDDTALWAAIEAALASHAGRIDAWLDRPPQTNEVGRSAVLIALGHWLADRYGLHLQLSELGASAGLNLMWDRYALRIGDSRFGPRDATVILRPDWKGVRPPAAAPRVAERRGTDLTPLGKDQMPRLLAYIWPDQPERLARTRAAIAGADAPVDQADAADWLAARLAAPTPGRCHLIYSTVAWQYFPPAAQARATALIEAAGARATVDAPLAWFGMEADSQTPGAGLTLRLWPGDLRLNFGRADFHCRWVTWSAPTGI